MLRNFNASWFVIGLIWVAMLLFLFTCKEPDMQDCSFPDQCENPYDF